MEKHNVEDTTKWIALERNRLGHTMPWAAILTLANRLEVSRELTTRPHTFTCGTEGVVADELTVKFKFPKGQLDIQPHTAFAENCVDHFISEFIDCELHGWFEHLYEAE